jgi:hypothetical protein
MAEIKPNGKLLNLWKEFRARTIAATPEEKSEFREAVPEGEYLAAWSDAGVTTLMTFAFDARVPISKRMVLLTQGISRFVDRYGKTRNTKTKVEEVSHKMKVHSERIAMLIASCGVVISSPDDIESIAERAHIPGVKMLIKKFRKHASAVTWSTPSGSEVEDFYRVVESGRAPRYETKRTHYFDAIRSALKTARAVAEPDVGTIPLYVPRRESDGAPITWHRRSGSAWVEATAEARRAFCYKLTGSLDDSYAKMMLRVVPESPTDEIGSLSEREFAVYCLVAHVPDLIDIKRRIPTVSMSPMQIYPGEATGGVTKRWMAKGWSSHQTKIREACRPAVAQPDALLVEMILAHMWITRGNWDGVALFAVRCETDTVTMGIEQGILIEKMRALDMNFGLNGKAGTAAPTPSTQGGSENKK